MSAGGHAVRRLREQPGARRATRCVLSIDIRLQALVEELFGDRRGALVAIDPRNGDVLAFVSKPNFDPNLFVDGIDVENWKALNESPDKPLLNRALRGAYPPGSTYKPFMALAALTLGKRTPQQAISDPGYYWFGNHSSATTRKAATASVDMYKSIVQSCDTYYYILANDLGVDAMHDFMAPLGFGQLTGIDMQGEVRGTLPSTEWKRKAYRKKEQQKWYAGETISLGIGQGYNTFTMLQLAQATATVAAGGRRHKPHLVKSIEHYESREARRVIGEELPPLPWKPEHVAFIHQALYGVTQEGTSARSFANAPYRTGGKTGTAQVIEIKANEKYNASKIDERHRDHALYMAFAPLEEPHIALAMIVENAGFGATAAAPIARRVFDFVLQGQYPSEEDIAATQAGKSAAPIGTPRPIDSVPLPGFSVDSAATPNALGPRRSRARGGRPQRDGAGAMPERAFNAPVAVAAPEAGVDRLRRTAAGRDGAARRRRPRDDVFGRLRPRHPLRRSRPQHAAGARRAVRGRPDSAADADEAGDSALCGRRAAADRHRAAGDRHHEEGRDPLAQRRRRRSSRARS